MTGPAATDAYGLLRRWEARARTLARPLPYAEDDPDQWRAIGMKLADERVAVPLSQLQGLASPPRLTRVPGCKPWLRGVASLRGRLLVLVDLAEFLLGRPVNESGRRRVLVIRNDSLPVGLLVSDVAGLRLFRGRPDSPGGGPSSVPWLAPYVGGHADDGEGRWWVLDLPRLTGDPGFLNAVR